MQIRSIHLITTNPYPPDLNEHVTNLMMQHGVEIKPNMALSGHTVASLTFFLPQGSTSKELFPRISTIRLWIRLPDGYLFLQVLHNFRSQIYFNAEDLPEFYQNDYGYVLKLGEAEKMKQ